MEVQKLAIFAGEFENTINSTVRQTNNGRFLWGCRKNRKVEDLVTAIDTVYQVEREFKLNLFDLEFLLNYVPFNEHFGCVIGCESKRGLCISIVQIHKNKVDPIGIGYNLNELASICHLPVVQKIDSNLLAIQIMQIDVLTGQNMLPRLFILQIPFERTGNIRLKHSIQLLYENETTKLLLHKEDKLYYFPVKKQFDKLVQIDLKTGDSYLKQLDSFPLLLDAVNSRDIRVTCEQDKFCILAFPQLAIFDLNSWKWSKIKLIEHPHMKQPSLLFVNSHGNLVTYFHKENSKQRLQIYIWQLHKTDPLVPTNKIKFKHSALKCAEWVIEKFGRAGNRTSFSLERFSYVLFDQLLVIQDLLLGIKKEFTPLHANQTIRLLRYIHLATNRGFMLFETSNDVRVSIVDVHLESDKFRFTGNSHSIFRITTEVGQAQNCVDDVSLLAEDIISVKVENSLFDDKLHLFKVDDMLSTLDLMKTFTIPDRHSQWFTKIGNEIVSARFSSVTRFDRVYLDNFLALQEDGTLIEHENTETCLQAKHDTNGYLIYPTGIQACFFNGQFYILVNFYPGDRTLPSTVFLSVLDYKRKEWSEIVLDLPRISECYMKFNVNHGILALLRHIEEYEDNAELKQTNVTAYRIPLRQRSGNVVEFVVVQGLGMWNFGQDRAAFYISVHISF